MNTKTIPEHYLEKVYWIEKVDNDRFEVYSGYLLATYDNQGIETHIVTNGDKTSCVVRHIISYFLTNKDAWLAVADILDKRGRTIVNR